jgi:hypothetical protein
MTTEKRSKWGVAARKLGGVAVLSVPVVALALFGGSALALFSGTTTVGDHEFRVLSTASRAQPATAQAPAATGDDQAEVEVTVWEKTAKGGTVSPAR